VSLVRRAAGIFACGLALLGLGLLRSGVLTLLLGRAAGVSTVTQVKGLRSRESQPSNQRMDQTGLGASISLKGCHPRLACLMCERQGGIQSPGHTS
jgi:hypothetical protein